MLLTSIDSLVLKLSVDSVDVYRYSRRGFLEMLGLKNATTINIGDDLIWRGIFCVRVISSYSLVSSQHHRENGGLLKEYDDEE